MSSVDKSSYTEKGNLVACININTCNKFKKVHFDRYRTRFI